MIGLEEKTHQMTVTRLESLVDGLTDLTRLRLPGAKAQLAG